MPCARSAISSDAVFIGAGARWFVCVWNGRFSLDKWGVWGVGLRGVAGCVWCDSRVRLPGGASFWSIGQDKEGAG